MECQRGFVERCSVVDPAQLTWSRIMKGVGRCKGVIFQVSEPCQFSRVKTNDFFPPVR